MEENVKKKNKLIPIIIVLVLLIVFGGLVAFKVFGSSGDTKEETKKEKNEKGATPLVYEITKEGSDNKIYLAGSMHAIKPNDFEYPKYFLDAYNESEYLAVEFDILNYLNVDTSYTYDDGTTIKDHISEETYKKLVEFLKSKGIYNEALEKYNLSFFTSLIEAYMLMNCGFSVTDGVDYEFLTRAHNENKKILEVESYEFQEDLLNSFSDRLNELMLIEYIDKYDEEVNSLKELYEAWKKGDPQELDKLLHEEDDEEYSEEDTKLIEDYNKKMETDRNIGMKEKLVSYFESEQNVFFLVGAAHLVGDDGIVNLLIQDGYTVRQINK